jgi:hypothetical protein
MAFWPRGLGDPVSRAASQAALGTAQPGQPQRPISSPVSAPAHTNRRLRRGEDCGCRWLQTRLSDGEGNGICRRGEDDLTDTKSSFQGHSQEDRANEGWQPGMAMTVKEMGAGVSASPALFIFGVNYVTENALPDGYARRHVIRRCRTHPEQLLASRRACRCCEAFHECGTTARLSWVQQSC